MRMIVPLLAMPLLASTLLLVGPPTIGHAQEDTRSTISVVGEGRVLVQPDVANVSLGVESTAPTLSEAQADAATRMQAVVDALLAQGVARDDIRTTRLGVNPVYDNRDASQLRGYRATNSVQVKVRDLGRVGTIVDAVTAAGANRIDGISFAIDDPEAPKDRARALALANARAKAEQLASLAGMRIVGVKAIVEADPTVRPVPVTREAAAPAAAAAPPPPVEPGTQEVRTQLSVVYVVE
jgi:uncharacterized protein YggE